MPLVVSGQIIPETDVSLQDPLLFIQKYGDNFQSENDHLKSEKEETITPEMNILYVNQREVAGLGPNDGNLQGLGTDMATTCHIVVLRCPQTKATALGHFDGSSTTQGVHDLVEFVSGISDDVCPHLKGESKTLDLHMVGGFDDIRGTSHIVSIELLTSFAGKLPGNPAVNLKTYCCCTFNQKLVPAQTNDEMIKSPVIFGLAVIIDSGKYFPAVFAKDAKGPNFPLTRTRIFSGPHSMMSLYDWSKKEATIESFSYNPHCVETLDIDKWLKATDQEILNKFSTSPLVEPSIYSGDVRTALQFMKENPNPKESVFKGKKALRYRKKGSDWEEIN